MATLKRLHRQAESRRSGRPAFTLLELIVVLLVLGILAAIAVPTFNRVKENSVERAAQTTLEAIDRNGEAIASSDPGLSDAAVATAALAEVSAPEGMTITRNTSGDGKEVTVEYTNGGIVASGKVAFSDGVGTITPAAVSGGSSGTTSTTAAPTTTTTAAFSLSYASTAFSTSQTSQTRAPSVSGGTASSFSYTGTLPNEVSFNTATGVFTGPSAWNFQVAQISTGEAHTCALTTSGGVKCWGYNSLGQIGDGTTTSRSTPVDVSGLTSGVAQVDVGEFHSCALTTGGGVKCWGLSFGTTPTDVSGLTSGVARISAGGEVVTCAVTTSGGAKCLGTNSYGQLGDGTTTNRSTAVDVSGLTSGVASIDVGALQTCAVTTSGAARCWGYNLYGQLGDGTTTDRSTPVGVSGLTSGVASISTGLSGTCVVTTSGGAKCWGINTYGQLTDGTTTSRSTPVDVSGLTSGVASISASGSYGTCAVTTSGAARCWGYNPDGQLGDGTTTDRDTPVGVSGLTSGVASISTYSKHTCAVMTSGAAKCWGGNTYGPFTTHQTGTGTATSRLTPADVIGVGNPGWPANITVTATSSTGSTANANVTLTNS